MPHAVWMPRSSPSEVPAHPRVIQKPDLMRDLEVLAVGRQDLGEQQKPPRGHASFDQALHRADLDDAHLDAVHSFEVAFEPAEYVVPIELAFAP